MRSVYFQLISGAAGDMILSSLIDLGVPVAFLKEQFERLPIEGLSIDTESVVRGGITCKKLKLSWSEQKKYRHLPDILSLIREGDYSSKVFENCEKVLMRIARAEARVHGVDLEKVHFHEIGAVDTIVDVLGTSLALEYLEVDEIHFSTLTVGHGVIDCAHGTMPVPVPATALMLEGFVFKTVDIETEILTPTGCALLTALGSQRQNASAKGGVPKSVGYGTGEKEFGRIPNVIRATLIQSEQKDDPIEKDTVQNKVTVLESDMDHISGEVMAFVAQELFKLGALDVSWVSVYMKKGRPGYRLTVVCNTDDCSKIMHCIFINTRTLGVRYHECKRVTLPRKSSKSKLLGNQIETKRFEIEGKHYSKAEYESLAALARKENIPLIDLYDEYGREESSPR